MKHSRQLFEHHCTLWARLVQKAAGTADPATYLLTHDARTPLFYLEAMTRILAQADDDKKIVRLNKQFKALEDGLGLMDYYAGLMKDFQSLKELPEFQQNLQTHRTIAAAHMNTLLGKYKWIPPRTGKKEADSADDSSNNALAALQKNIGKLDWPKDKKMCKILKKFYRSEIDELKLQLKEPLKEIEQDMHELRRDIRWLSIVPQAFKGFVQLKTIDPIPEPFAKYATPEVVKSPFNQLPVIEDFKHVVQMNAPAYYAMSWLIAQLGELKDQGLRVLALTEWLQEHKKLSVNQANQAAVMILGDKQIGGIEFILQEAQKCVGQARADKVFKHLLA